MAMVYLESSSTDPSFNLALEQFVFDQLPRDKEYFMLWQNDNAIIIGKHQNTAEEVNEEYVRENGIKVVRRLSGGGAVYHDMGNINFTFIMNAEHAETMDLQSFCIPVIRALEKIGVHAEVNGRNDITIDGKKFSGNAQYRKEGRIMHHGTILFDSNLSVVAAALNVTKDKIESKGVKSVRSRVTNVKPYVPEEITLQQFWEVLKRYMVEEQNMEQYKLEKDEMKMIEELQKERYATWEWNYGYSPKYSIQKERRVENCGKIQICMDVEKGRIKAFTTYGDYFGNGDPADIANALIGCPLEPSALESALENLSIGYYFNNLTSEELIKIILQ